MAGPKVSLIQRFHCTYILLFTSAIIGFQVMPTACLALVPLPPEDALPAATMTGGGTTGGEVDKGLAIDQNQTPPRNRLYIIIGKSFC